MQIYDLNRLSYDNNLKSLKLQDNAGKAAQPAAKGPAETESVSRAERIAQLKEAFRAGKSVDLNRLADTLLGTGIFFDERV